MPDRLAFDIETDGLLDDLKTIHSLVIRDLDTGDLVSSCASNALYPPIEEGLALLEEAELIAGHNVIKFDIPAIKKVHPWWSPKGTVRDTMVMAQLMVPMDALREEDKHRVAKNGMPSKFLGQQSLKAWGYRTGVLKTDFGTEDPGTDDWSEWTEEMQFYCEDDVAATVALWQYLQKKDWAEQSVELEHEVARIIARQERFGFPFNSEKARKLHVKLQEAYDEIANDLIALFPPWLKADGASPSKYIREPSRTRRCKPLKEAAHLYAPGAEIVYSKAQQEEGQPYAWGSYCKITEVLFNPRSRQHISSRLRWKYGWLPDEKTDKGSDKVDEAVLAKLPYPEAAQLAELLTLNKRISQLATGRQAWLLQVNEKTGRVHGRVSTNGAISGRMTHSGPNVGQVPSMKVSFGKECRELFEAPEGWLIVGCDADSLELRDLAGYMVRFDGGSYIETVLKGDKSKGTDNHSVNARAFGLDPKGSYEVDGKTISGRDMSKTGFYGLIYGCGNEKLGWIMGARGPLKWVWFQGCGPNATAPSKRRQEAGNGRWFDQAAAARGKEAKQGIFEGLPALGKLNEAVTARAKKRGYILGLDGRRLPIRKAHAALNTLLQSAGAVQMKQALVILDRTLQESGLVPGRDYEFMANVHDEWQIAVNLKGEDPNRVLGCLSHLRSKDPDDVGQAEHALGSMEPSFVAAVERVRQVGETAAWAIAEAGRVLDFRCPLAGNYDIGRNWAETH